MTATNDRAALLDGIVGRIAPANLEQHRLSAAFPAMPSDDFQLLVDSVENIGIQNPIVIFEGMVIDGWHRYRAAKETRSECPCVDLAEDVDPKDFVIAQNERRRHLTKSQIADAVISVFSWQPIGRPNNYAPGAELKTASELAEIAGVSARTIVDAKFVQQYAAPEVKAAVKSGVMSVKAASATVKPQKTVTPKPAPESVAEEEPAFNPADYELPELREAVRVLSEENDALKDRLAVSQITGTDDEKTAVLETIADLRKTVSDLEREVSAIAASRDRYMRDNADMKSQLAMQRKQLAKLNLGVS